MTWLIVLAASCAGAAVATGFPPPPVALLNRLRNGGARPARRGGVGAFAPSVVSLLAVGCGLAVVVHSPALAVVAVSAAGVVLRLRRRRRARAAAAARRADVVELCSGLAAELRAGRTPREALMRAAAGPGSVVALCPAAVTAAGSGGDVPAGLMHASSADGAGALRWLAACWQVAEEQGAGLAAAAERLADHGRADEAVRQEVSTQLAGPRATAVLLAVLPGVGVLFGTGLGAAPLDILLRTPWGLGCLGLGVLLAAAGLMWTERIARTAEESA